LPFASLASISQDTQAEAAVGDPFAPFIKSGEEMVGAKGATTTKFLKFFLPIGPPAADLNGARAKD